MERCDDRLSEIAAAKINLALHVVGRREDGYHLLDSLVTFASSTGDRLTFSHADQDGFSLSGRFGHLLSADDPGNLVLKARDGCAGSCKTPAPMFAGAYPSGEKPACRGRHRRRLGRCGRHASGLARLWKAPSEIDGMDHLALSLGADVPMCLRSRPLHARVSAKTSGNWNCRGWRWCLPIRWWPSPRPISSVA